MTKVKAETFARGCNKNIFSWGKPFKDRFRDVINIFLAVINILIFYNNFEDDDFS